MVDDNKNGIPDHLEWMKGPAYQLKRLGQTAANVAGFAAQRGAQGARTAARDVGNVVRNAGLIPGMAASSVGLPSSVKLGGSAAKPKLGDKPQSGFRWKLGEGPTPSSAPQAPSDTGLGFADFLRMASQMVGAAPQMAMANYDPQRNSLKGRASENDARLEAMYRQLRGSIDADAPVLKQAYQEAIDATGQNAQRAQEQAQQATDAANARNSDVLAALGIQEAQKNIIEQGRDLNSQTAQQIGDMASRGQVAGDRLVSNQATSLKHNTNVGNAAGLEGNLQRASNQSRLQAMLAELDMQEQQENAGRQAQNMSAQQGRLGEQLSLAQWLSGQQTDERRYQDSLQQSAIEAAMGAEQPPQLPSLNEMLQSLSALGIVIPEDPSDLAKLLDSARRYSYN